MCYIVSNCIVPCHCLHTLQAGLSQPLRTHPYQSQNKWASSDITPENLNNESWQKLIRLRFAEVSRKNNWSTQQWQKVFRVVTSDRIEFSWIDFVLIHQGCRDYTSEIWLQIVKVCSNIFSTEASRSFHKRR